jgi:acetyl-CoA carboxylase biotin carboxyl carrier protein
MTDTNAQDIEALVRTFDDSNWDELRVVIDGLEIYLSKKSGDRLQTPVSVSRGADTATPGAWPPAASPLTVTAAPLPSDAGKAAAINIPDGMIVVRAPNLGTFYRSPKPGAPPYVVIGQRVEADTEICLIEVMKLFTSVLAGVSGTVSKVLVEDSQLVEFDQPLFLIEPLA